MAIVAYKSHKIIIVYNTKCAQTTLYEVFGQPWRPAETDYFHEPIGGAELDDLDKFIRNYPDYYVAVFVRNPYARLASMFTFNRKSFRPRGKFPWPTFKEYIKNEPNRLIPLNLFIGNSFDKIDFIGRQETLAKDVETLANKFNIEFKGIPHSNRSHNPYTQWYDRYDVKTRNIVYNAYKKDIEMFDYNFWSNFEIPI